MRFIRATSALNDARKFVYKHCSYKTFNRDNYLDYENGESKSSTEPNEGPAIDTGMSLSLATLGETLQREQPKIAVSLENRRRFWDPPNDQPKTWGHSKYLRDTGGGEVVPTRCSEIRIDDARCQQRLLRKLTQDSTI